MHSNREKNKSRSIHKIKAFNKDEVVVQQSGISNSSRRVQESTFFLDTHQNVNFMYLMSNTMGVTSGAGALVFSVVLCVLYVCLSFHFVGHGLVCLMT